MATKQPSTSRSSVASVSVLRMRTPVTPLSSPSTSSRVWNSFSSMLPLATLSISLSTRMGSARNLSRRWIRVTLRQMLDRYSASSTAVLPPPITTTSLLR
ncbi:Uncharacterised protein [Bordetella pertussis]|nr:Uncharacterised protein [Bordetella pertussis]CFU02005.1 Uncharacterised protein [Bordetella pertussis]CPN26828.1 Uncharacterised protein [Bordetella pertussis]